MTAPARPARRRLLRAGGLCLGGLCLVWAAWAGYLLWPRGDDTATAGEGEPPADAVVMLAGADDGRHELARRLVEQGRVPVLVVSNPEGDDEQRAWSLCHGDDRPSTAEAICVVPEPRTTWGEALAVDRLARERGWRRVVVVTNRPHTLRARETVRRAAGLEVRMHPVEHVDWARLPVHAVWEAAGFVKARALGRW